MPEIDDLAVTANRKELMAIICAISIAIEVTQSPNTTCTMVCDNATF